MKKFIQQHRWWLAGLTLAFIVTTLPWLSRAPINWDAAQFILGVKHFDIAMHQPHPPGYPLYIFTTWFISQVLPVQVVVVALSAIFAYGAMLGLYYTAWRLLGRKPLAAVLAGLLLVNPLFWYFREVGLTYTIDAFASIVIGCLTILLQHTFNHQSRQRLAYASAVFVALLAGFRPSSAVLLFGLLVWQWWLVRDHKSILICLGVVFGGVLVWFVPMITLTGWSSYWQTTWNLFSSNIATPSLAQLWYFASLLFASLAGYCILYVVTFIWLVVEAVQKRRWPHWPYLVMTVLWLLPALLVYGGVHIGQVGYMLILLPPIFLGLGAPIWWLWQRQRYLTIVVVSLCALMQILSFAWLTPAYTHPQYQPRYRIDLALQWLAQRYPTLFIYTGSSIVQADDQLLALADVVTTYPPEATVVLSPRDLSTNGVLNDDTFRELSVLTPNVRIFELPSTAGQAVDSEYDYRRTTTPGTTLLIPDTINYIVITADQLNTAQLPKGLLVERRITAANVGYYVGIMNNDFTFLGFSIKHASMQR